MIKAVVFDVGETLVDETREYGTWADWLGVPRHTFAAVFGSVIESGKDYRETFQVFRPGFNLTVEREARVAAGQPEWFGEDDLYPDVRSTLSALRAAGVWVGIAGNQTIRAGGLLRTLDLPTDLIATSDDWGVEKPDPLFFEKIIQASPIDEPSEVVYVGDRIDNDLRPAKEVGLKTIFVQRGPWGWISRNSPELNHVADWQVKSLREILDLLPVS
jgi:HAD superfamily hydrolase (TIGR01549 family)